MVGRRPDRLARYGARAVRLATVTPLASIFGSGFLIIIPIRERELGALGDRPIGIRDPVAQPAVECRGDEQQLTVRSLEHLADLLDQTRTGARFDWQRREPGGTSGGMTLACS